MRHWQINRQRPRYIGRYGCPEYYVQQHNRAYGSPRKIETYVAGKVRLMYNLMYDLKKVRELYATGTFSQTPGNISVESLYTAYVYLVACHITAIGSARACLRHWFRSS